MTVAVNTVAFIDDDEDLRLANADSLHLAGFEPLLFASAEEALARLTPDFPGIVVSDIRMPRLDGLQLFHRLKEMDDGLPVILITGHGDIPMAVEAMREGVHDFVSKPYGAERLIGSVRRALETRRLVLENRRLKEMVQSSVDEAFPLIGETPVMERLRQTLRHIADADVDVLLLGETGSGKEVVANTLHRWSRRKSRPFVAVNCGAVPETVMESELFGHEAGAFTGAQRRRIGRIEHADGGTLFLDELDSMTPALQVKLLRVLDSREIAPLGTNEIRPVDLRVVAATKIDLSDPIKRGEFRQDLYYRLNAVTLRIPPLRERKADIPLLFAHFLNRASARYGREAPPVTASVKRRLLDHDWEGNVRELSRFAERFALGLLDEDSAAGPDRPGEPLPLPQRVDNYEKDVICETLLAHGGDVKACIEELGIPRKTFYDKVKRHGIQLNDFRG
ncbi:sigma-54 dependent transcriptional regulator [Telmatospirillum sp. J64-1]|uniref:sigma-54-dependent transcriptional regulator n=1 Tax=Telmatospirillum sp. J64-1 TaxID=2502183 RepID=UPI00115F4EEF|nr:sigma-54 dependent transcriptional regulator [Telmatospirillum sp. J64-1]